MEAQRNPGSVPCFSPCKAHPPPPFSIRPLEDNINAPPSNDELVSLLPASYRTASDNLVAAGRDVQACIEKELDLRRLTKIFDWLWIAGQPMPPRPLHQILLSQEILITERMDMHLVWTTGRMFLKPIPRFLLEPSFWTCYLSCVHSCRCPTDGSSGKCPESVPKSPGVPEHVQNCNQKLWKSALGFLFSYVAVITHETDFLVAKEKLLLPREVTWPAWRCLVHQLDTEHIYPNIDRRFFYGELRLSRLDKIYYLSQTPLRGYMSRWKQYGPFFKYNFAWLASATVYIAIVLTAMQVGLATDALVGNNAFQSVSYGFTIFSILGPLVVTGMIIIIFCFLFVDNWVATAAYRKQRFRCIDKAK